MGFLVIDVMLLFLVNYPDPNVRSYIYGMLAATMSIFSAVLLNQAVTSFVISQILEGHPPRGFGIEVGIKEQVEVGTVKFLACFTLLNVLCYKLRNTPKYLVAVEEIGAHITAFAGVHFFGFMQAGLTKKLHMSAFLEIPIAAIILGICASVASRVRSFYRVPPEQAAKAAAAAAAQEGYAAMEPPAEESEESEPGFQGEDLGTTLESEKEWLHAIHKAENEAFAIILSFVVAQAVACMITGDLSRMEGENTHGEVDDDREAHHIRNLAYTSLIFLGLLVLTTYCANRGEHQSSTPTSMRKDALEPKLPPRAGRNIMDGQVWARLVNLWENFLAMSMSWTSMRVAYWTMRSILHEQHQAQVATAAVVTGVSVVLIIMLDAVADRINDSKAERREAEAILNKGDWEQQLQPASAPLQPGQRPLQARRPGELQDIGGEGASSAASEESSSDSDALPRLPFGSSFKDVRRLKNSLVGNKELQSVIMDENSLEKALRTIIVGLSLLVGLCWEKAFDAADEALVEGFEICRRHEVISKFLVAVVNVALVVPAWLWYMVPMAKMHWKEHEAMMELEKLQAEALSQDSRTNMANFQHASERLRDQELIDAAKLVLMRRGRAASEKMVADLQAAMYKVE